MEAKAAGYESMHSGFMYFYALPKNSIKEVMKQVLWIAKEEMESDAFTCMTVLDNEKEMLADLHFCPGDGAFHWYLVNWSLGDKTIGTHEIGAILC
jgi:hypothetical protein